MISPPSRYALLLVARLLVDKKLTDDEAALLIDAITQYPPIPSPSPITRPIDSRDWTTHYG